MMRWAIDTNVLIVANGRETSASDHCRLRCVEFLMSVFREKHCVLLDQGGVVADQYKKYCRASGQPGIGDRFLFELRNRIDFVVSVELVLDEELRYRDFPRVPSLENFDVSDRVFVALAIAGEGTVANATDSDWYEHCEALRSEKVKIEFLCGVEHFAPKSKPKKAPGKRRKK